MARFTFKAGSGKVYELLRPNQITLGLCGMPDSMFAQFIQKQRAGDAAEEADAVMKEAAAMRQVFELLPAVLAYHVISPRLFNGHPADAPAGQITIGELPEADPMEILQALVPAMLTEGGREQMTAAADFREGTAGAAVPGDVPPIFAQPGPPASGE